MKRNFDFKDINLIPRLCVVRSRSECETSMSLGKNSFRVPIYPANMESILNVELAEKLAAKKYFYTMHRFLSNRQQIDFVKSMKNKNLIASISIGVNYDSYRLLEKLQEYDLHPDYITVDIAHGHSIKMEEMLKHIKTSTNFNSFVIAGNISTVHAAKDLEYWGADAVKVGVGPGCFAKNTRILMANGFYKNIIDIEPGEFVINKDGKAVKVKNVFSTGYRDVIKYRTNTGINYTICTPEHKHFIGDLSSTKSYKDTGYAKILDKKSKKNPKCSKYKWEEIQNCTKENSVFLLPKKINFQFANNFNIPLYKKGLNYINLIPSEELGYIFGTFLGDGNSKINLRDSGTIQSASISWTFGKKEINIVNKLNHCLKFIFNKEGIIKFKNSVIIVTFYDKPFAEFLSLFDKRENKNLPENLLVKSPAYLKGLYNGLMDSDGNCSTDNRNKFDNTSLKLIELFNILCYEINGYFPNNALKIKSSGSINCNLNNCKQAYTVTELKRPDYRLTNNYQIVKILEESDEIIDNIEVWDLEIDDETHSFIANNCIVHNSACITAMQTGFGSRGVQASVLREIAMSGINIPIILDGGIKEHGDIAKALALGADMVMAGNMFAGFEESPGEKKVTAEGTFKEYWGSASTGTHGKTNRIEGKKTLIPYKNKSIFDELQSIEESLQSSISYGGGKDLSALYNVEYLNLQE